MTEIDQSDLPPGSRRVTIDGVVAEIVELETKGSFTAALALALTALKAAPEHPHLNHLAAIMAHKTGDNGLAIAHGVKSMHLAPTVALYPGNMTEIFRGAGLIDRAMECAELSVKLDPENKGAWLNKALIHYEQLDLEECRSAAIEAVKIDPDYPEAHFVMAENDLLHGLIPSGLFEYEHRFKLDQGKAMLPLTDRPQWDGKPLPPGKLLLVADQGFGDCIQFARFIPWVATLAPAPQLALSPELVGILGGLPGVGRYTTSFTDASPYTAYMPLSGLWRLWRQSLEGNLRDGVLPPPTPLMESEIYANQNQLFWLNRLQDHFGSPCRPRVAICWAGRPTHKNDRKRSISFHQLAPLFRADVELISVQKGDAAKQAAQYYGNAPLLDLGPELNNLSDTTALLSAVDYVVTVDTAIAHLAGSVGTQTEVLLPYAPDWRWGLGSDRTPWYPMLRLHRQSKPYDWTGVVERAVAKIEAEH